MTTLAQEHDCLLLDLDGTVFTGHEATTGAVETLATLTARILYVTNNASRRPAEVAKHLQAMGFTAESADVVTSADTDPSSPSRESRVPRMFSNALNATHVIWKLKLSVKLTCPG